MPQRVKSHSRVTRWASAADGNVGSMTAPFTELELAYLADQRLGRLATVQRLPSSRRVNPAGAASNRAVVEATQSSGWGSKSMSRKVEMRPAPR